MIGLIIFLGLIIFFIMMTVYAVNYFLRGGISFLVVIPSIVLFILIIAMFPSVYKGMTFYSVLYSIFAVGGISLFLIRYFR